MITSRRDLLATLGAASAVVAQAQRLPRLRPWKPKLGILCRFSDSNIEFARQEGFKSLQLMVDGRVEDAQVDHIKTTVQRSGLNISSTGAMVNHIAPDPVTRDRINTQFSHLIETTGRLGVPYVGTASGNMPGRPLNEQVDEILRVYTERYFPLCQKHNVRILWEPWVGGPNVATGPVGYEALFKAFGDSPYVGLQFDASHLQWQMIDPVQTARDFVDKIYDVHLKDLEIFWPILRRVGVQPLNNARWWRFRLPGFGMVDWKALFTVFMDAGYQGALNIEHEDELYYPPYDSAGNFTEQFKDGFRVAHQFLKQSIPG